MVKGYWKRDKDMEGRDEHGKRLVWNGTLLFRRIMVQ